MTTRTADAAARISTHRSTTALPTTAQPTERPTTGQPAAVPTPENRGWQAGAGSVRRTAEVTEVARVEESLPPRPQRLTGKMEMSVDGQSWKMKLENGQSIDLVNSEKGTRLQNSNQPLNPMYARGFLGDDLTMTVRGQLGADGKFQVEDFAPGGSDKYVSGRVQLRLNGETIPRGDARAAQATVVVNTARGDVEIADPTLAEKFRLAGPLGVILPGDPKMKDGKLVYEAAPTQYFVLGRPQAQAGQSSPTPEKQADGTYLTQHAMAYHGFNGPTVVDANAAGRVNHMDRNWLLGDFQLGSGDKAGTLAQFNASYVSGANGSSSLNASAEVVPSVVATDPAARAAAQEKLATLRAANPNLAAIEQQVGNQSHTSPPVDFMAFNLKTPAPVAQPQP